MAVSAWSPRSIASSPSHTVTPRLLTTLAVDEHQHLRALEPDRRVAGFDLGANHRSHRRRWWGSLSNVATRAYTSPPWVKSDTAPSEAPLLRAQNACTTTASLGTEPLLGAQRRGQTPQTPGNPRTSMSGAGYAICGALVAVEGPRDLTEIVVSPVRVPGLAVGGSPGNEGPNPQVSGSRHEGSSCR
jgi:hypothetical protein